MHSMVSLAANGSSSVRPAWEAPNRSLVSIVRNAPRACDTSSGTVIIRSLRFGIVDDADQAVAINVRDIRRFFKPAALCDLRTIHLVPRLGQADPRPAGAAHGLQARSLIQIKAKPVTTANISCARSCRRRDGILLSPVSRD